jgi:hypothetical protein
MLRALATGLALTLFGFAIHSPANESAKPVFPNVDIVSKGSSLEYSPSKLTLTGQKGGCKIYPSAVRNRAQLTGELTITNTTTTNQVLLFDGSITSGKLLPHQMIYFCGPVGRWTLSLKSDPNAELNVQVKR